MLRLTLSLMVVLGLAMSAKADYQFTIVQTSGFTAAGNAPTTGFFNVVLNATNGPNFNDHTTPRLVTDFTVALASANPSLTFGLPTAPVAGPFAPPTWNGFVGINFGPTQFAFLNSGPSTAAVGGSVVAVVTVYSGC